MKYIKYFAVFMLTFFSFAFNCLAIKDIKVDSNSLSPLFETDVFVYNYYTYNDNVVISVVKDENENVTGYGSFNVVDGLNEFVVKSEVAGITKEYKINVFKNYVKDSDKTSALLKSLSIKNYDINFSSNIFEYEVSINEEDTLEIDYETVSELENVTISGNGNFNETDNLIEIIVISGDGNNSNTYKIYVKKSIPVFEENKDMEEPVKEFTDFNKKVSMVCVILAASGLIVGIFYLFFLKKF